MTVTSVCSRSECTHSTVLYGSTTAVATCGHAHTVKLNLDFLVWGWNARGATGDQTEENEEGERDPE